MPSNLTDVSSFDTVIGPQPTDVRNAAAVRTYLQTLANRTRFLIDRLTALADIAALKAIAAPADGLVRHVKAKGIYVFDVSSSAAEALPWIVQPNSGSGRWLHALQAVQAQASGLATLDGSAKVPAAQVPNRLVAASVAKLTANVSVPNTGTWTDVVSLAVASCAVGDILVVDAFAAVNTGGSGSANTRLVVDDGGVNQTGQLCQTPTNVTLGNASFHSLWTVVNAGTVTAKLQAVSSASGNFIGGAATGSSQQSSVRVLHFRP